ncbi:INTERNAL ALTERNATIVE NAD(P)H-UBIQUINONE OXIDOREDUCTASE A1 MITOCHONDRIAL [Salix koriyanagi]|uniref:NADH:ubiquinone reductase (non-electrogenic) n=1 Tax=Salix koriyanagi TaxID=2511006 RepID=A0A9Q0ZKW9_9ROSI|nr:INTERNAL ALTERNATIVE NAD(P)H-UBIQUINONE OXIDOREDUCTASE A1 MITOCHONDRIAL [Salix koriyanagi]
MLSENPGESIWIFSIPANFPENKLVLIILLQVYPKKKRKAFYAVLFIGGRPTGVEFSGELSYQERCSGPVYACSGLCLSDPNKGCRKAGGFLDENLENLSGPGIDEKGGSLAGFVSWLIWRSAYLTRVVCWRNRLYVAVNWATTLVFGGDNSRTQQCHSRETLV